MIVGQAGHHPNVSVFDDPGMRLKNHLSYKKHLFNAVCSAIKKKILIKNTYLMLFQCLSVLCLYLWNSSNLLLFTKGYHLVTYNYIF